MTERGAGNARDAVRRAVGWGLILAAVAWSGLFAWRFARSEIVRQQWRAFEEEHPGGETLSERLLADSLERIPAGPRVLFNDDLAATYGAIPWFLLLAAAVSAFFAIMQQFKPPERRHWL